MPWLRGLLVAVGLAGLMLDGLWLKFLGAAISAAALTSILQSLSLRRRLAEMIRPEWATLSDQELTHAELNDLARSLESIRGKLKGRINRVATEKERLRAVLDGMTEAVVSLDAEGRIHRSNDAARALFASPGEARGLTLLETLRQPALHDLAQAALQGEAGETELEMAGGKPFLARVRPLARGGAVLVLVDLSQLRRLERVRRDFVANVEHELRTPVAVIRSSAEVLSVHGGLEGKSLELSQAIHRHAERLGLIIGSLLELSRLESGQVSVETHPVDLLPLLRRCATLAADQRPDVEFSIKERNIENIRVFADKQALERVLINLLDNGGKYGGGEVWIELESGSERCRLAVVDAGPGVEPRHRDRLFERFYRVDSGRSRGKGGSGLGLAIAKHLCGLMGAKLAYEEGQPSGSRFVIDLKRALEPPQSS